MPIRLRVFLFVITPAEFYISLVAFLFGIERRMNVEIVDKEHND